MNRYVANLIVIVSLGGPLTSGCTADDEPRWRVHIEEAVVLEGENAWVCVLVDPGGSYKQDWGCRLSTHEDVDLRESLLPDAIVELRLSNDGAVLLSVELDTDESQEYAASADGRTLRVSVTDLGP